MSAREAVCSGLLLPPGSVHEARLHLRTGDFRAALADLEPALARLGTDAETYADLCEAQLGLGRRTEAIGNCRRAIQINPEYARPRALLLRAGAR